MQRRFFCQIKRGASVARCRCSQRFSAGIAAVFVIDDCSSVLTAMDGNN